MKIDHFRAEQMRKDHTSTLFFNPLSLGGTNIRGTMSYPLYPYRSNELVVMFIYGKDFTRGTNIFLIPDTIQTLAGLISLYICLAAIVLCIIRRKFKLRRDGLFAAFIDTLIPFIGGGNLRIGHKWEKWFFGILLIGAFFITSLFAGDLVDCIIRIWNQKISTFEQLAKINPPIVIDPTLAPYSERIQAMLRFVKHYMKYFIFKNN